MIKKKRNRSQSIRRHPQIRPMFAGLRHYDRKKVTLDVTVIDEEGWEIPFESVDVSPSGIFVRSNYLYEIGSVHDLVLRDPDSGHVVKLSGQIVRVEGKKDPQGAPAGMAYKFMGTDTHTFKGLSELVATL